MGFVLDMRMKICDTTTTKKDEGNTHTHTHTHTHTEKVKCLPACEFEHTCENLLWTIISVMAVFQLISGCFILTAVSSL